MAVKIPALRSSYDKVGGLVSFGRLLDKMRLKARGALPEGWFTGPQVGADRRCVAFLHVTYEALETRALEGGTDEEVQAWCFRCGRQPSAEEIEMWNEFSRKRGWRDDATTALEEAKREAGLGHRSDIQTFVLGYLVELLSQRPFSAFCRERIFRPLGMHHTGWFLREIDVARHATPYVSVSDQMPARQAELFRAASAVDVKSLPRGTLVPLCLYGFANYPTVR